MSKTPIVDLIDQSQALTTPMVGQLDDTLPNDDHEISPSSTILSHLDVDEIVKVIGEGDEEETESDEDEALLTQNLAPSPPPLNQPSNHINNVPENVMIQEQRNKVTVESSTEEQGQSGAGEMGEVILSKPTKPTNSFPRAGKKLREGSYVQGWTFDFSPLIVLRRSNDAKGKSRQIDGTNVRHRNRLTGNRKGTSQVVGDAKPIESINCVEKVHDAVLHQVSEVSAKSRIQSLFRRYLDSQLQHGHDCHCHHGQLKSIMQVKSEQDAAIRALKHGPRQFHARPVPRHVHLLGAFPRLTFSKGVQDSNTVEDAKVNESERTQYSKNCDSDKVCDSEQNADDQRP